MAIAMYGIIDKYGECVVKATADACRMIAVRAKRDGDGTSYEVWSKAAGLIDDAHKHLEEN